MSSTIIDETVILRYLLDDDEVLSPRAAKVIATRTARVYPEIITRVAVTLRDVNKVPRVEIATAMTKLLDYGFVDSFRYLYPDAVGRYSWWSYMFHAREKNAGWRIDYFLVSDRIADKIKAAEIHNEVFGSDHCPVELDIDL